MTTLQKIIKYLAVAFGVVLILGIGSGVLGLLGILTGISAWQDRTEVSIAEVGSSYGPFSDSIDRLELEIGAADIEFVLGGDLLAQTDNPHITVEEKNGTLVIRETSHIGNLEGSSLKIQIPEDKIFDRVKMATGAGRFRLESLTCRKLEWELGAGQAEMNALTVTGEADIDGGMGQFIIHDGSIHNLDFDMGMGETEVCLLLTGNAEITAGIGSLSLTVPAALEDYTVSAEQGLGRIEVDGMTITGKGTLGSGSNRLELEGGIGDIRVWFE